MRSLSPKSLAIAALALALILFVVAGALESRVPLLPAAAALAVAAGLGVKARMGRHPTAADTERFLVDQLVTRGYAGAFKLSGLQSRAARGFGRLQFNVRYDAELIMTEPLYRPVQLTPEMTGRFTPRRISALCSIANRLGSELGPKAEGIAKTVPPDPFEFRYVEAASAQGLTLRLEGASDVRWGRRGVWVYADDGLPTVFDRLLKTGLPRARYGHAVVLDSSDGRVWFRDTMRAWEAFEARVAELQRSAEESRTERAREVVVRFFAEVATGTVFHGQGTSATGQMGPTPYFLEFTALDAGAGVATFSLRNDSGWSRARAFTGVVSGDPSGESAVLTAHTRAVDARPEGGPLLEVGADFDLDVRWLAEAGGGLLGTCGDVVLKLDPLTPDQTVERRASVYPREGLLRVAMQAGATFAGTLRGDGVIETFTLAFRESDEGTSEAEVRCGSEMLRYAVEPAGSPYAQERCDIVLRRAEGGEAGVFASICWIRLDLRGGDWEGRAGPGEVEKQVRLRRVRSV
ncbi:hypothetical protein ASA1KI_20500 [Opitutales bacterium ASA1]|uniref:hypothetical protein n=1 Tax=Congregicoccus parvus TaxID=3081749 RepID=UPI002B30A895|nr:hypothetical protein ASA1KI_20500 [Opitutales bacterium ASA1]